MFLTNNLGSRERKPKGPVVQMVKQRSAKPFSVVQIYLGPFSVVQIYLGVEPFGLRSAGGRGGPLGVTPPASFLGILTGDRLEVDYLLWV